MQTWLATHASIVYETFCCGPKFRVCHGLDNLLEAQPVCTYQSIYADLVGCIRLLHIRIAEIYADNSVAPANYLVIKVRALLQSLDLDWEDKHWRGSTTRSSVGVGPSQDAPCGGRHHQR